MLLNPIITASGGLKPQIVVAAPTGSAVTCTTPGGIVMQGVEISGTWTFANLPGVGTYIIVGTLGDKTKTQTVIIDTVGVYEVTITYSLYLYNAGDECTGVTGGWTGQRFNGESGYRLGTATKEATDLYLYAKSTGAGSLYDAGFFTNNKIDLTNYSKLYYEVKEVQGGGTGTYKFMGTFNSYDSSGGTRINSFWWNEVALGIRNIDISSIIGSYYYGFGNWANNGATSYVRISKIWLE